MLFLVAKGARDDIIIISVNAMTKARILVKKKRNKETPMKLPELLQFRRRMCDNYLHHIYHPHMWKLLLLFWLDLIVRFNLMFSLELLRSTLFLEKITSDAVPPCTSHSDWTIQRMNSFFPSIKTSHVSRYCFYWNSLSERTQLLYCLIQ